MAFSDEKFVANWRRSLLAVVVAAIVVALLWCVPPLLVEQVRVRLDEPANEYYLANLEDAYRRTLAQILGGFGLLYGLYLTQRRIVATEDNVRVGQDNVRVAEEGHITERFTKAIAQLGDKEMAIRLGGIYALERITKDSEKDHGPIMEVLTAYVREKATTQGEYGEKAALKPTTDIQAILTVLGRRETTGKNRENDRLDLSNTQLIGAILHEANLHGADLRGAYLISAKLYAAKLYAAKLYGANLHGAILGGADLRGANLRAADLSGADLRRADLLLADLSGANLLGANLSGADLREAKNLASKQVRSAKNWQEAGLPDSL